MLNDCFVDDVSFCWEMNGEKQCFNGKGGIREAYEELIATKTYDRIDFTKSVTKKDKNLYELVCKMSYEDDDGFCQVNCYINKQRNVSMCGALYKYIGVNGDKHGYVQRK